MKYFIYFLYNSKGKVDDYIPPFLKAVRKHYDFIHVVVNGELQEKEQAKLKIADKVQIRPNDEFDVGAYKAAIFSNPDEFYEKCTEVTLANFTFFAPIGSMEPYFSWAKKSKADFWGISAHKEIIPNPFTNEGILPYHIQSHWISVGPKILKSGDFIDYWRNLPPITSYMDSVLIHESQCTRHFSEKGYSYDLFLKDENYDSAYPAFNAVDEAVRDGLPILKRRNFYHTPAIYYDHFNVNLSRALDHIEDNKLFDMDMIWQSVASTDPGVLYSSADLLRVVPDGRYVQVRKTRTCNVVLLISGMPTKLQLQEIIDSVKFSAAVTIIVRKGIDRKALETHTKKNTTIKRYLVHECAEPDDLFRRLSDVAKNLSKNNDDPLIFCSIDPLELKKFQYGIRHLCADQTVVRFGYEELAKSRYFGLAIPAIRTYGQPAETDDLTVEAKNDIIYEMSGMTVQPKFDGLTLYSDSGVFWCRAGFLKLITEEILTRTIDDRVVFEDAGPDASSSDDVDLRKVDLFLSIGLAPFAASNEYITLVMSNTSAVGRNFAKAEARLRMVSEQIGTQNPFDLQHQVGYAAQYLSQESREDLFDSIHHKAYEAGWNAASKPNWEAGYNQARTDLGMEAAPKMAAFKAAYKVEYKRPTKSFARRLVSRKTWRRAGRRLSKLMSKN